MLEGPGGEFETCMKSPWGTPPAPLHTKWEEGALRTFCAGQLVFLKENSGATDDLPARWARMAHSARLDIYRPDARGGMAKCRPPRVAWGRGTWCSVQIHGNSCSAHGCTLGSLGSHFFLISVAYSSYGLKSWYQKRLKSDTFSFCTKVIRFMPLFL